MKRMVSSVVLLVMVGWAAFMLWNSFQLVRITREEQRNRVKVHDQIFQVANELLGQAGVATPLNMALAAVENDFPTSDERAHVLLLRCQSLGWQDGPVAAKDTCAAAVEASSSLPERYPAAVMELALNQGRLGNVDSGLALLDTLPASENDLLRTKQHWARSRLLLMRHSERDVKRAEEEANMAMSSLEDAIAIQPCLEEYRAIGGVRLGEAFIETNRPLDARAVLLPALTLQRKLDAQNPEYAEYRLYLIRILRALGRAGGAAEAAEAAALIPALRARDPQRWEYNAGL